MTKGRPKKNTGPHTRTGISVPTPIWKRARLKGVLTGISMNAAIVRLLRAWADDELEMPAEVPPDAGSTTDE